MYQFYSRLDIIFYVQFYLTCPLVLCGVPGCRSPECPCDPQQELLLFTSCKLLVLFSACKSWCVSHQGNIFQTELYKWVVQIYIKVDFIDGCGPSLVVGIKGVNGQFCVVITVVIVIITTFENLLAFVMHYSKCFIQLLYIHCFVSQEYLQKSFWIVFEKPCLLYLKKWFSMNNQFLNCVNLSSPLFFS